MKFRIGTITLTLFMALFMVTNVSSAEPKGIDSKESYSMVIEDPSHTFIVDVRTVAEYLFVGHPDMPNGVANIPLKFYPTWEMNTEFVKKVTERYSKTDRLIIICRSGARARDAAYMLADAGFTKTLYMTDSFEGQSYKNGHRTVDGWKANNLPYTYGLDPDLMYQ